MRRSLLDFKNVIDVSFQFGLGWLLSFFQPARTGCGGATACSTSGRAFDA